MADTKTTALTENTAPVSTDIMYMVDDPGSSPLSQKITLATLSTFVKSTGGRVLISEQTPTGTGTVTFSSIPATYKSLEIEIVARSTKATVTSDTLRCWLNNDTTAANYRYSLVEGHGTTSAGAAGGADSQLGGILPAAGSPAGSCASINLRINDYAATTFNKNVLSHFTVRRDDASIYQLSGVGGIEWESTTAVNRVDLVIDGGNYDTGSAARLYGVY